MNTKLIRQRRVGPNPMSLKPYKEDTAGIDKVTLRSKSVQSKPYGILVTGATGFIGSRLVRALSERGYTVKAISRRHLGDKPNAKYVVADLFSEEQLFTALQGVEVAYYLVIPWRVTKKAGRILPQGKGCRRRIFLGLRQGQESGASSTLEGW